MKLTKKYIGFIFLLSAMLLVGCSGDDSPNADPTGDEKEIRLNAEVWQVMEGTRAATYDNSTLTSGSFKCYAYNDGETSLYLDGLTVSYSAGQWSFDAGRQVWPDNVLNFFAHMPADLDGTCYSFSSYTEDTPVLTCADLPVTITRGSDATTKELIVAYAPQQDKAGTNSSLQPTPGQVALSFKHPFARVRFKLSAESGSNVIVNSITIPAIYRDGTCTFNGLANPQTFTWSSLDDNDEGLVISAPSVGSQATDDGAYYLVIPNNYGSKTFTVSATRTDWSNVTKDISADVTVNWQAGRSYTYTLTLSKYALKVDIDKYTEQW